MGMITEISVQKRNKKRVNVFIDGEFVCGLEAFVALAEGLKAGREVTVSELERIQLKSDAEAAFSKAANYLGVRMRSKNEIIRYLSGKGYSNYVIGDVIEKLMKYNYINDEAFVREYVGFASKTRSGRRIKADLFRMGIDDKTADESLENLEGQDAAADKAAAKYLRRREFDANKLAAHLQSKGFDWDIIRGAVARAGEGNTDD